VVKEYNGQLGAAKQLYLDKQEIYTYPVYRSVGGQPLPDGASIEAALEAALVALA
jgi:hypothetical protein